MLISLLCLQNLKIADLCCVGAFFFTLRRFVAVCVRKRETVTCSLQ